MKKVQCHLRHLWGGAISASGQVYEIGADGVLECSDDAAARLCSGLTGHWTYIRPPVAEAPVVSSAVEAPAVVVAAPDAPAPVVLEAAPLVAPPLVEAAEIREAAVELEAAKPLESSKKKRGK